MSLGGRGQPYLRLSELRRPSTTGARAVAIGELVGSFVSQFVLRSETRGGGEMLRALLCRCLKVFSATYRTSGFIDAAASCSLGNEHGVAGSKDPPIDGVVVVPGGGAVELGWSELWAAVAGELRGHTHGIPSASAPTTNTVHIDGHSMTNADAPFVTPSRWLASSLFEAAHSGIGTEHRDLLLRRVHCITEVCAQLSVAYAQIPQQLLANALGIESKTLGQHENIALQRLRMFWAHKFLTAATSSASVVAGSADPAIALLDMDTFGIGTDDVGPHLGLLLSRRKMYVKVPACPLLLSVADCSLSLISFAHSRRMGVDCSTARLVDATAAGVTSPLTLFLMGQYPIVTLNNPTYREAW